MLDLSDEVAHFLNSKGIFGQKLGDILPRGLEMGDFTDQSATDCL